MGTIAIVEDSRIDRRFAAAGMLAAGYGVREIIPYTLPQVLVNLRQCRPAAVLLDYYMPGCPAEAVVAACRQDPELAEVPIVLVTAHRDAPGATRLDIDGLVFKPYRSRDLQSALLVALLHRAPAATGDDLPREGVA